MSKIKAGLPKIEEWYSILIELKKIPFFHGLYWQLKQLIPGTFMEKNLLVSTEKNRRFFPWSPSKLWNQGTQRTKQFEASTQLGERQRLKNSNHSWGEPTGVGKARGFPSSLRNKPTKIGEKPTASPRDTCQMLGLIFSCNKISFLKGGSETARSS